MIVRITDLSEDVHRVEFEQRAELLNEVLAKSRFAGEQHFDNELEVHGELYRHGTDVHFSGQLSGRVRCTCLRCLDEFEWPVHRDFKFLIAKAGLEDTPEDDDGVDHYSGDDFDLGPLVREQAVLALDATVVCSESCQGLCPGCGANRNHEPCRCQG